MKKFSTGSFKRVYDSKGKGGCEAIIWEGLGQMLVQQILTSVVPIRVEYSKAIVNRDGYLRRLATCKMRDGVEVKLVLHTCEGGPNFSQKWRAGEAAITYLDGRTLELSLRHDSIFPEKVLWVRWDESNGPLLEFWDLK